MVGPAFKLNLRSVEKGLDVGVGATGGWSLHTGRLETASAVAPLALQLSEHLRVNLNGGWLYSRLGNHRHMAFVGAQVERQLTSKLSLMVEAFNRDRGRAGGQIGLRWTPGEGTVDLDIMAGHRLDGVGRSAITLGLTLRN